MKRVLPLLIVCIVLAMAATAHAAEADASAILGRWYTDGDESIVEIYNCGESYCGKIVWLQEPLDPETGEEKKDTYNPDESMRERKIIGMDIVWGFKSGRGKSWGGGKIYDPESGKTYSCKAKLKKDKLNIRGFIGVSLLGRTTVWTRSGQGPE